MKIQLLGTAGSEGFPALFCRCDVCKRARQEGGRSIRTRASVLIDDVLMVDFSGDTYAHLITQNLDLSQVENLLISHSHEDHLAPTEIACRFPPFSYLPDGWHTMNVYGNDGVKAKLEPVLAHDRFGRLSFTEVKVFEPIRVGDYMVTPLPAVHMQTEQAMLFLIEKEGKALIYGHDTGCILPGIYDYLCEKKVQLSAMLIDCTYGLNREDIGGHMNFRQNLEVRRKMIECGIAKEDTLFISTHFAHTGFATYDDMIRQPRPESVLIGYDGMIVNI